MGVLAGRVAIITGTASEHGIGRAIARRYAEEGASLYLVDREDESQMQAAANDCRSKCADSETQKVEYGIFDLAQEGTAEEMVRSAFEAFGRVDVLVNNAGVRARVTFEEVARSVFNEAVAVNLAAPFFASQAVAPIMRRQGGGRIIHIASQMGTVANERRSVYGMTKAGLIYLAKAMAFELAPHGITVNAISPGPVETGFMKQEMEKFPHLARDRHSYMRINRLGRPEEIAEVALFLAGAAPELLVGQNIIVDGGYTIH
jgi:NAD(P)-dependent dehydrogenase (short-subunit alcohol dehydrogenase family)